MILKDLKGGTTFLIETSSDSEWILNENSENFLWFEFQWKFIGKTWNFVI
jgi:hypothetical protein